MEEKQDENEKYLELYNQYKFLTLSVISRYSFVYPDEIFAEVWEKIYTKVISKKFDYDHIGITNYIITITHNHCKDVLKKNTVRRNSFKNLDVLEYEPQEVSVDEAVKQVFLKIKKLVNPFTFKLIEMRYIDGLSFEEISKITGKSKTNLRVMVHRTIEKLNKEELINNIF